MDVFVRYMLHVVTVFCLFYGYVTSVDVDEVTTGTIQVIEGESIALTCDLRDTDEDYIWFRNPNYVLTMGDKLIESLPPDIANRITVTCSNVSEACYMTMNRLTRSDAGIYGCGYQEGGNRISASFAKLIVLVPPADTSPECRLDDMRGVPIYSDMPQIGDQVQLSCIIRGGDPRPTVYLARDIIPLTSGVMGSFTKQYTLSQNDEGSTFTCVMTHPALSQPSTCTFLTLRSRPIPTVTAPTTRRRNIYTVRALTTTAQLSQRMTSEMMPLQTLGIPTRPYSTDEVQTAPFLTTTKKVENSSKSTFQTTLFLESQPTPLTTLSLALIVVCAILVIVILCYGVSKILRRKKTNQAPSPNVYNDRSDPPADYLELNAERENEGYEKPYAQLKRESVDESVNNEDYAYATASVNYEVATVSEEYESVN